jgi:DNA-binding XRE family transcriptional regulator
MNNNTDKPWREQDPVVQPWRDYDRFKAMYIDQGQTQEQLAKVWNCSKPTVAVWAKRHQLRKSAPGSALRGSNSPTDEAINLLRTWEDLPKSLKPEARKLLLELVRGLS